MVLLATYLGNVCLIQIYKDFPVFSYRSFIGFFCFIFRFIVYFELNFVYFIMYTLKLFFFFLHSNIPLTQYHLLKRYSFSIGLPCFSIFCQKLFAHLCTRISILLPQPMGLLFYTNSILS